MRRTAATVVASGEGEGGGGSDVDGAAAPVGLRQRRGLQGARRDAAMRMECAESVGSGGVERGHGVDLRR